ncbi:fluoride efflux transporter FluC [Agromyces indicus]|uniref:Fluoride-specific ion channel FluC n=1 Tax=Agromyces indicus TaxID=758919 RepID=A0ABU1FN38_9MICO|nr:CrcB family protein [Agromyces indicus]MDR5692722.1 CrcB family protein [Agromyces indicus]
MTAAPPHRRWRSLGLVAAGGTVGTALREALLLLAPDLARFPATTFAINLAGAFALGVLLEVLVRSGPDEGRRRDLRLLVGTGVLGGFTTYSALATATALLAVSGLAGWAIAYALGTVVLGAALSVAGIAVGAALAARPGGGAAPGASS